MLIPAKHEKLEKNILVLGSEVLELLSRTRYNVEDLFSEMKTTKNIDLDQYFNVVTFLWLSRLIDFNSHQISIKK